jgi:hypothetical protein
VSEKDAVPTGLDSNSIAVNPTLKRGANKHCAYGAGKSGNVDALFKRVRES